MKLNSIIARKTIIDHMQMTDLKPHNLFLSSKLIPSIKAPRTRYSEFLKDQERRKLPSLKLYS